MPYGEQKNVLGDWKKSRKKQKDEDAKKKGDSGLHGVD